MKKLKTLYTCESGLGLLDKGRPFNAWTEKGAQFMIGDSFPILVNSNDITKTGLEVYRVINPNNVYMPED